MYESTYSDIFVTNNLVQEIAEVLYGQWEVLLGVWDEYMVVLKHQNTAPFPR
jgi:hypothetical protein